MLLSAGVGITPLLSMLLGVLKSQPEREVFFVHGALNGRVHAFRDFVRDLASRHPNLSVHYRYNEATEEDRTMRWHDSEGLIDAELLEDMLPERTADYYFCGPKPFHRDFPFQRFIASDPCVSSRRLLCGGGSYFGMSTAIHVRGRRVTAANHQRGLCCGTRWGAADRRYDHSEDESRTLT